MMQGDSYSLGFTVRNNAGSIVTPDDVIDVEFTIGHLRKTFQSGKISFADNRWFFPITQAESLDMRPMATKAQIRVKWKNGVVEGKEIHGVRISESISREVL